MSDTPSIDAALVRRLVAAQFPQWADLPVRPVDSDGWDNRTFHLGDAMTVRLPSAEGYVGQIDKEHQWLPVLASHLPLPVPAPLAKGAPGSGYPFPWSVYRWIQGEVASVERIGDLTEFATDLADFLAALQRIDATDGPPPARHAGFRGGPLKTYDAETRRTIEALGDRIPGDAATTVWEAALRATWYGGPVWFHGDVAVGNLLVRDGRLAAVIDFGCSGVGDPACDTVIAWTLLSGESRQAFRDGLGVDSATWARGRGWALWKALITLAQHIDTDPGQAAAARRVMERVLSEFEESGGFGESPGASPDPRCHRPSRSSR
ncbi:aminoglycoside phosphotransferase family protein [Streptomyces scopuliridis]|uniref:Aminoglycoside phosphotransferase family protein n=1 Tax=Streptomyces scopuliridis TaxID=452529 RepID=A0ACD4ZI84_9ACTN|nr:aminoglycoside phosphotransferase family protein [Streptomyces scopuliridis]WSB33749.1 aminoglycoside phosphotransferase family protein [Streptomyces scopuliridis]WSB98022.1 aminoglycoside phosphotransferase family protein [Streptomyces scopuliridis]WSC08276.1 aminoglycoside phosphotransferase family protein [Streptomyces scopuliridis]